MKTSMNFGIGTYIHHDLRVTWWNFWEYRSKVNTSICMWRCCAVGVHIKERSHQRTTATKDVYLHYLSTTPGIPARKLLLSYNKVSLYSHQLIV